MERFARSEFERAHSSERKKLVDDLAKTLTLPSVDTQNRPLMDT